MPDFSPALELAWQIAADEALQLGSPLLEPHHLLIGVCSVEKALNASSGTRPAWSESKLESAAQEFQAWAECLAETGTDCLALRRTVRRLATSTIGPSSDPTTKIRRSSASHDVFARAIVLSTADGSENTNLLHLAAALFEKPQEKIDAALQELGSRRTDLQLAVLRRLTQMLSKPQHDREDAAAFRIAATLDASSAFFPSGKFALDEARAALLYELPLHFGRGSSVTELLQETVNRISKVIPGASNAALLVNDRASGELLLLAHVPPGAPAISMTLARRVLETREACVWVRGEGESTLSLDAHGVQSGIYAPLLWNGEALGIFSVSSCASRSEPSRDDLRLVVALAHHAAMALANNRFQNDLKRKGEVLERLLTTFSPRLRNTLLSKAERGRLRLGGEKSEVTLLCSDIRGFTKMSENLAAEEITDLLNDYFDGLVEAIFQNDGAIDKFIGDGILAVFGSPEPDPNQHEKALRAALAMQKAMRDRNAARRLRGLVACEIGIGLHCGEVLHGFIGTTTRMEFTVIGDAVNRAARYCAGAAGGQILVSPQLFQRTWQIAKVQPTSIPTKHEGEFEAYRLEGLKDSPPQKAGAAVNPPNSQTDRATG
jgi:adenylate cyclase